MHAAVNAHLLSPQAGYRQAGVSRYVQQLLGHLWQINAADRWTIYAPPGVDHALLGAPSTVTIRTSHLPTTNPLARIAWEQAVAPPALLRARPDVLLCPLNIMPLLSPVPTVVTIHDLAFLRFRLHRPSKRRYLALLTRLSSRRAAQIIAVSEFTRQEVIALLGVDPARVTTIHNGLNVAVGRPNDATLASFRHDRSLPERFVLFVGTLEPRKNVATLLRAYAAVRDQLRMPLVIGGGKGWMYDELFRLVTELGLTDDVRFLGFVPDDDLRLLYAAATIVAYPSLYEGFGFPPLEAMAVGTPVVTSSAASLPEVVGDAAVTIAPTDEAALAAALVRLASDEALRQRLRLAGPERARQFSWQRTAEQTSAVLHAVAHT